MFQIEIFQYTPKMTDIYTHFYNNIENKNKSGMENSFNGNGIANYHIEDSLDNKFLKIKTINHPLICRYFDYIKDDNNYIFISESAGDSLDEIIDLKMSEKAYFQKEEVIKIIYQLLLAINQLEKKGISLRFLEPKRILINDEGLLKIRNYIVDILFKPEELKLIKYV
jgi:serine/threonine protein kinase